MHYFDKKNKYLIADILNLTWLFFAVRHRRGTVRRIILLRVERFHTRRIHRGVDRHTRRVQRHGRMLDARRIHLRRYHAHPRRVQGLTGTGQLRRVRMLTGVNTGRVHRRRVQAGGMHGRRLDIGRMYRGRMHAGRRLGMEHDGRVGR